MHIAICSDAGSGVAGHGYMYGVAIANFVGATFLLVVTCYQSPILV